MSNQKATTVAFSMLLVVSLVAGIAAPAAAQDGDGTTIPDDPRENSDEQGNETATKYEGSVDATLHIVNYDYNGGTMSVTLESEMQQEILVTSPLGSMQDEGVSGVERKRMKIPEGKTTVRMDVDEYRGMAAVSIATRRDAAVVSTGGNALTALGKVTPYTAWFGGSGLAIVITSFAGWRLMAKEGGAPESGYKN